MGFLCESREASERVENDHVVGLSTVHSKNCILSKLLSFRLAITS